MIMKRFLALIALASSAAPAQQQPGDGNVPAPDLFDSQIVCSSQLPSTVPTPTVAPMGATESALDAAIGMGNTRIAGASIRNDLGYAIPAQGGNCGQGFGMSPFTAAAQGSIATDVAAGYTALLPKFTIVYGDPDNVHSTGTAGAVARARAALAAAEGEETTSPALLESLRRTLASAIERDDDARAEFDAIAQGPIYRAAAAEWMAKAAVTRSIEDYNAAVTETLSVQASLDALNYTDYVPLGNRDLVQSVVLIFDGMGTVNHAQLQQYVNGDLNNPQVATVDGDGVTDTSDSNFDAASNLVVPTRLVDGALQPVTSAASVDAVRTNRDNYRIAADALNTLKEENQNLFFQTIIDEAARRAEAEAEHYERQYRNALADTTNRNPLTVDLPSTPENEAAPYSIASRHAEYLNASNKRMAAEADLRDKAAKREAATRNVIGAFQNPGAFQEQLVARREALKAQADRRVAESSSPSPVLTGLAEEAALALNEAQEALAAYRNLVGDPEDPDNPVAGLIGTLLKTDGDDGRAVVDAIARTYEKTVGNGDAIAALTADTGNGDGQDGPVTANARRLESLDGRVTKNEEGIGALREQADINTGMIATNAGNISTNASNIAVNASGIAVNASGIAVNASGIVDNRSHISRNAATLAEHGAFIGRNAGNIAANRGRIGANAAAITMNSGLIDANRQMIGELGSDLDIVRAGVAASIALSRMPSVEGGGVSFGAGTYAGEMAYAVGFQVQRGFGTFDIGLTSSGGEIGAGVGVGLKIWRPEFSR